MGAIEETADLAELRTRATGLINERDWAGLAALESGLRAGPPGEHTLSVATRTRYGTLTARPLRYVIR